MSIGLGDRLKIRAMVYTAAAPVPFFWPMRAFIHHNPLHGLEHLPFAEAVERAERLFHGRGYLKRRDYQRYLAQGKVERDALTAAVDGFLAGRATVPGVDLRRWLVTLLTGLSEPATVQTTLAGTDDIHAALHGTACRRGLGDDDTGTLKEQLSDTLLGDRPMYEAVDALYGTGIGDELDELVIKSCLDFFDEGQSVWSMPQRENGFFQAWREVARRNVRLFLRGLDVRHTLSADEGPEGIIVYVMNALQVPEQDWVACFTRELARLHGWAGFIRWRASAGHYHWTQRYPADLVDYLAVRLTLAHALLARRQRQGIATTRSAVGAAIEQRTSETYLRHELYGGSVLPELAHRVDMALSSGRERGISRVFDAYVARRREVEAERQAARLSALAGLAGETAALKRLDAVQLDGLLQTLRSFERAEGVVWLRAMESQSMHRLADGISLAPPPVRDKRPFVQALFCIDTRSERIRRHLEGVGDYQTYGIAGFFGVPVSFIELGKGSELQLCPVLLTPKNLVLEMSAVTQRDEAALTALEKAMHHLKESVLTPFVTVEAIGLLFGLDMIGKTVAPCSYTRWRRRLHPDKPPTRLLLDKLSREQADSIVRAVQRAVIAKAVEQECALAPEQVTDDMIRQLREAALEHAVCESEVVAALGLNDDGAHAFVARLRKAYRINTSFAQLQMERLGRIGFSPDEQARFVTQALRSIGLTTDFSRFVLLVGHGSRSENNPYESALDCGACGGNHGLVSARVLAQMANKPDVRRRLRAGGIEIADDVWFVPALHNTTTDEITLFDLDLLPPSHLVYLDRLRSGLTAASRLCAAERMPTLVPDVREGDPVAGYRSAQRNSMDWSQVRPEWGLSRNAFFVIGRRDLTRSLPLDGRAFLHSYDYRVDPKRRLLENILAGPLVVGQWINMEHYFSTVDSERYGSGSKVYHNVAGRFGVMTGNLSDLRTGLPAQTVLAQGEPYHEPMRLITAIEAPFEHARRAVEGVVSVKRLLRNGWIRLLVIDPETARVHVYNDGDWETLAQSVNSEPVARNARSA